MTFWQFIALLLVAGICGSIARSLAGYSHGGCLGAIALGFVGALLGMWLARLAELPDLLTITIAGKPFPIVWTIIGSALFAAVLSALTRKKRE